MGHRLTKSQCNLLIADKHKAAHSGIFEMNSILKSWFVSVCNNKMATFLHFSAEFVGEELVNRIFPVCCFTPLLWRFSCGCMLSVADLLGEQKWMWKLNHSLNCTTEQRVCLAVTLVRQGGGWKEKGWGGSGGIWKEKTCLCVCLPSSRCIWAAGWLAK